MKQQYSATNTNHFGQGECNIWADHLWTDSRAAANKGLAMYYCNGADTNPYFISYSNLINKSQLIKLYAEYNLLDSLSKVRFKESSLKDRMVILTVTGDWAITCYCLHTTLSK